MIKKLTAIIISTTMMLSICISFWGCEIENEGMVIGTDEFLDTLNPFTNRTMLSSEVLNLIYDPLIRYDENLVSIPCLAEYWEVSDDYLTWTFHLVKTKWHDGEDFTSSDVKYTYELFMTKLGAESAYGSYFAGIEDIKCPDDRTVVIKTTKPKANMLQNTTPILPEHIWSNVGDERILDFKNDTPVGTGPYTFGELGDGFLKLFVNEEYFTASGHVPSYTFVEYESSHSAAKALKTGDIDVALSLSMDQFSQLKEEEAIDVLSGQIAVITQVSINVSEESNATGNPLLKDAEVRHAIEYCIDKKRGLKTAYYGSGTMGTTIINSTNPYHWQPTPFLLRDYDIKMAKRILSKAGYRDTNNDGIREDRFGNPLQFELISIIDNPEDLKYSQIIKAGCKKAGIGIDCVTLDNSTIQDKINVSDYDMLINRTGADVDPSVILETMTTDFGNVSGWSNEKYDELFFELEDTLDRGERVEMILKMQQILYKETPNIVLMYDSSIQAIRSDRWEGYIDIPIGGCYFLNKSIMNYMKMNSK